SATPATRSPRPGCSRPPSRWPPSSARAGSGSTRSPPATCGVRTCSATSRIWPTSPAPPPRRCTPRPRPRPICGACPPPTRWPMRWCSWPRRWRPRSPASAWTSTAASTTGEHPGPAPSYPERVSVERLTEISANQRAAFLAEGTADADTRIGRIDRLQAMILDHSEAICAAVDTDFGNRPASLTMIADVVSGLAEMDYLRKNLARWMRPHRPVRAARLAGVTMEIRAVPRGVVGIIGPWNFPLQLLIQPAAAALAAGNRVLLRPSSSTPNLAALLASIAEDYFDPTELAVITSDIASGAEFGALPFDHLFFTGSTDTGRKIQAAAAANLTPVTLELGGKNPAVVARSTGLERAAGRIGAARMVNSGQTCLSPDLAFVPIESVERFVETVLSVWRKDYPRIVGNDQYVSIIDQAAYERITALIDDAAAKGATVRTAAPADEALPDAERRLIAPTIVTGVTPEMDIYTEEVFGPVLAVFGYRD